jgi:hypothetical protein
VQVLLQQRRSEKSSYGFYGAVQQLAASWTRVPTVAPTDEVHRPARCVSDRFALSDTVWKANTCVVGYAKHAGLADYELIAASVSGTREALMLYVSATGLRAESFEAIVKRVLEGITPQAGR